MKALTHEEVKRHIETQGYKLKSLYRGVKRQILIECPNGHTYYVKAGTFRTGSRCSICAYSNGSRNGPEHGKKTINKRYLTDPR